MASLIIVDDHPAICMAIKFILQENGHEVVGEYCNGADALQQIHHLRPEIVILDINMPHVDGFEVLKRLSELDFKPKIIVLSSLDSEHIKVRCIQLGVHGFLSKVEDLSNIIEVINKVKFDKSVFEFGLRIDARKTGNIDDGSALSTLSERERIVMISLCHGNANKKIAKDLMLSEKTVSTYKNRLMAKINVTNIADLIDFAKRNNVL